MKKNVSEESVGKAGGPPITRERVVEWTKRDIAAAAYFLTMLSKFPEVVDSLANELYDRATQDADDKRKLDGDAA